MDFGEPSAAQSSRRSRTHGERTHRSRRERRPGSTSTDFSGFGTTTATPTLPLLVRITDFALVGALWLVTGWFGGRTPLGQFLLSACATVAATAWSAHQLTSPTRSWTRFSAFPLWLLAGGLWLLQVVDLPAEWRALLSPKLAEYLPLWFENSRVDLPRASWQTLSLAPGQTILGLPLFLSYGLLFFTALQRWQTLADLQRFLRWVALAVASWAVFGLVQYLTHNGKMYWTVETPTPFMGFCVSGPFTNRNHMGQFLALGIGPLIWCLQAALQDWQRSEAPFARYQPVFWGAALGLTALAAVLTLSRGGLLALAIAGGVTVALSARYQSQQLVWIAGLIAAVVLGTGSTGLDRVTARFEHSESDARLAIWQANWQVANDFPWVGTGIGTHQNAHYLRLEKPVPDREFVYAESSVLQVASEAGFLGLGLAVVAMLWCLHAPLRLQFTNASPDIVVLAAAVAGGLLANFFHACVDFVWHVPACMVIVLYFAAGGCRLWQWSRADVERTPSTRPASVPGWLCTATVVAAAGCVAMGVASGSAASETAVRTYQRLAWQPPPDAESMSEADVEFYFQERSSAALRAARQRPYDSKMQLAAARACLLMFERNMQTSDNPLTLLEIRDAANASGFEDAVALRGWVQKVCGKNWKLLSGTQKFAERALQACPAEGGAYLVLSELAFLKEPTGQLESDLIAQAVRLRSADSTIRFAAGQQAALANQLDVALQHWRFCYQFGPSDRERVARILPHMLTAEEALAALQPDWGSVLRLIQAYEQAGQKDELMTLYRYRAEGAEQAARSGEPPHAMEAAWRVAIECRSLLGEQDTALQLLTEAIESHQGLRRQYGMLLFQAGRYEEALEHLKWAAARNPDDRAAHATLNQTLEKIHRRPSEILTTSGSTSDRS